MANTTSDDNRVLVDVVRVCGVRELHRCISVCLVGETCICMHDDTYRCTEVASVREVFGFLSQGSSCNQQKSR
jgi:hypothetical protein